MTTKEIYCQSDFVTKAKIINKEYRNKKNESTLAQSINGITYTVDHLHVYKKDHQKKFPNQVITASNSALCGVYWLEVGKEYYLLGDQDNNSLFINLCSIINFHPLNGITGEGKSNVNVIEDNSKIIC